MKNAIIIAAVLTLIIYAGYIVIKSEKEKHESENARLEYETKVSQLNADIAHYSKKNKDLISEVKDLKKANDIHRNKRSEIKTEWRDRYLKAKSSPCDTNVINDLGKIHEKSEVQCDSSIANLETQVLKLEEVVSNDSTIILSKDSIITLSNEVIQNQDKQLKKEKRKALFLKIGAGIALTVAIVLSI